jgi:hypothetical protein
MYEYNFGFRNTQRITWLTEQPLASREGSGLLGSANRSEMHLLLQSNRNIDLHLFLLFTLVTLRVAVLFVHQKFT